MSQPPWPGWAPPPPPPPPAQGGAGAGSPRSHGVARPVRLRRRGASFRPAGGRRPRLPQVPPARPRRGMSVLAVMLCVALPLLGLGAVWLVLSGLSDG